MLRKFGAHKLRVMLSQRPSEKVPIFFHKIKSVQTRERAIRDYLHTCKSREEQLQLVQQIYQFYESENKQNVAIDEIKWVRVFQAIFTMRD